MHVIRLLSQIGESHHKNILHEVITVHTTQHVQLWSKVDTGDFHIMIIGKNHNEKYVCIAGSMPSRKGLKFIAHRFKWNKWWFGHSSERSGKIFLAPSGKSEILAKPYSVQPQQQRIGQTEKSKTIQKLWLETGKWTPLKRSWNSESIDFYIEEKIKLLKK